MTINIPCPDCGCQTCAAETTDGKKVELQICRCNDGSGEYEITITPENNGEPEYEKHQCPEGDIVDCLTSRFSIDLTSMDHKCFN